MTYYQSADILIPHTLFIGKWDPFHKSHVEMIEQVRSRTKLPILVLVRRGNCDFHETFRAELIRLWMIENKVEGIIMIIPDIEGVHCGCDVGYKEILDTPVHVSATTIREEIGNGNHSWRKKVASERVADRIADYIRRVSNA